MTQVRSTGPLEEATPGDEGSPKRRGAPSALVGRLGAVGGYALLNALLARRLDPDGFGTYAVTTSLALGGSLIVSGGLNRSLLRDVAAVLAAPDRHDRAAQIRGVRRALLVTAPIGAIVTALAVKLLTTGDAQLCVTTAALAVVLGLVLVVSDGLRGLGAATAADLTSGRNGGAVALLCTAAAITIGVVPSTVLGALTASLAVTAGVLAVAALELRRRWNDRDLSALRATAGSAGAALRSAAPFGVTQVMLLVAAQVDLWIASAVLTENDAGWYAAAVRLMAIVVIPLQAAQLTMVARIAGLHAQGNSARLEREVRRAATLAGLPAAALLLACIGAGGLLLRVAFGPGYQEAWPVLAILAVGQLVNVLTGLCGLALSMTGHERVVVAVSTLGALGSALLCLVAAELGGMVWLAAASAATTAATFVAFWLLARSILGIWTHPTLSALRRSAKAST